MTQPTLSRADARTLPDKLHPFSLAHPLDGELVVRIEDEGRIRVTRGELLVVHTTCELKPPAPGATLDLLVFHVEPEWMETTAKTLDLDLGHPRVPWSVEPADSPLSRRASQLLTGLHMDGFGDTPEGRLGRAARWLDLVSAAWSSRRGDVERRGVRGPRRSAFLGAVERLREAPLEDCSLDAFARDLGVSARQASRLFREQLGTSFQDHVGRLRLERAQHLLATTDMPITTVAMESGWRSVSQFNARFRRHTSLTPGAFREAASRSSWSTWEAGADSETSSTARRSCPSIQTLSEACPR